MLRLILVTLGCGAGGLWGMRAIVGAGCLLAWNDFFRPTAWARYTGWMHPNVFPAHHFTYAVLLFAVFFTTWKKRWTGATFYLLVLIAWIWICTAKAFHRETAYLKAVEATKYIVPAVIMSLALTTRRWQQFFVYTLAYSVGAWMAHHGLLTLLRQAPEINMAIPAGQMTDRNDFLVAGTGCLPLLIYVGWYYEGWYRKWVRLGTKAMVGLAVVCFFTSLSRGAVLGITSLLMFWSFMTGRFLKRMSVAVVLLVIGVALSPDFLWERMSTIEMGVEQDEASAARRIGHMLTAIDVTLDYPIFGVGPSNYPLIAPAYNDTASEPHSIWLKCSAEFGFTMLVFFVAIVARIVKQLLVVARSARREKEKETEGMATALACAIVGFLATGTFTSQFLSEYLWSIIAVSGAFLASEAVRTKAPKATADAEAPVLAGAAAE